jgi:hypothetical protein
VRITRYIEILYIFDEQGHEDGFFHPMAKNRGVRVFSNLKMFSSISCTI